MKKAALPLAALTLSLVCAFHSPHAEEVTACAIKDQPRSFDRQTINSRGTAADVRQATSRRGNDYSTFSLEDGGCSLKVFVWGHPTIKTGECVQVEGLFETEHHQGAYTFYNELQADKVSPCGT
jgi:hypothetical protein